MKLFKKKDLNTNQVSVNTDRKFGKTHKKKNTYIVSLNGVMADLGLFELCKTMPLAVVTLNGKEYQPQGGFMKCTEFPNPGATQMFYAFKHLKPLMGEKLSATIVEYLDKYSGKPVLTLYPQNHVYFHNLNKSAVVHVENTDEGKCLYIQNIDKLDMDEMYKLNHASRHDLFAQVEMRQKFIKEYNRQK